MSRRGAKRVSFLAKVDHTMPPAAFLPCEEIDAHAIRYKPWHGKKRSTL